MGLQVEVAAVSDTPQLVPTEPESKLDVGVGQRIVCEVCAGVAHLPHRGGLDAILQ